MHEITLYGKGEPITFQYPASWEEVTGEQLVVITKAQALNATDTGVRFDLLRDLAGIPAELMELMPPADQLMQEVDVTDRSGPWKPVEKWEWRLLPSLDWAFGAPCYRKSLVPAIAHEGVDYAGPDDGFDHMTLNQWVYCTSLLKAFRQAKPEEQEDALNTFLAALYQPAGTEWDFNLIGPALKASLAPVPVTTKLAAVINYEAIHATLPLLYTRVFDPDGEVMDNPQGLFAIIHDASESVAFAPMGTAEKALLHKVLGHTEYNLYKDAKAEAAAKAKTP